MLAYHILKFHVPSTNFNDDEVLRLMKNFDNNAINVGELIQQVKEYNRQSKLDMLLKNDNN